YLGEKIAEGPPGEVTVDPKVREVYFGSSLDGNPTEFMGEAVEPGEVLLSVDLGGLNYGKARAMGKVGIEVREGECVSIVGLNGAGKTSLFKAMLGFVDYDGEIQWQGEPLRGQTPAAVVRKGISKCPETRELFSYMSVRE